jgi:hypothetical protein
MLKRIPEEKKELARALLKAGKSYREVAAALDICIASVHRVMKEPIEEVEPLVSEIRKKLSARSYLLADHILSMTDDWDVTNASLKDKALAAAILMDKAMLLERGHRPLPPSSISEGQRPPPSGLTGPDEAVEGPVHAKGPPPSGDGEGVSDPQGEGVSDPPGTETLKHPPALITC